MKYCLFSFCRIVIMILVKIVKFNWFYLEILVGCLVVDLLECYGDWGGGKNFKKCGYFYLNIGK